MKFKNLFRQMVLLLVISIVIYILQVLVFHESHDTVFYLFQDLAFLPITIIVTTLLVGALLEKQGKAERIEKSRILSGSFFSIIGNPLMEQLYVLLDEDFRIQWNETELEKIMDFLNAKTDTILTIASNPNLLEHELFTDLLWAVLHLREELDSRMEENISKKEKMHILSDAQRVVDLYIENWGQYCEYTKKEYPFFYQGKTFMKWKSRMEEIENAKK